jgi:predicted permease
MRESGITIWRFGFPMLHLEQAYYEEFKKQLLEEVQSLPGIRNAATTTNVPLSGGSWTHGIHIGAMEGSSKFTWVSPTYFQTMGIPLITGRGFSENDSSVSPRVAIVNETFVRTYLSGIKPLGQTMRTMEEPSYPSTVFEVVGIIPDTKYNSLRGETPPMAFVPAAQFPVTADGPWMQMVVDAGVPSAAIAEAIRHKLKEIHPELIVVSYDFQESIHDGLLRERMMAILSGFFGLLAALLVMVGLYGVISYLVARRRNEIGIRIALGATREQVIRLVMRDAAIMLVIGVIAGTTLSLVAGRSASSMLFGLKPYDPVTLIFAMALLALIATLASLIPAWRAARLDPTVALRSE